MSFINILDNVAKLSPVKLVLSAIDMAHAKTPAMEREPLQNEIKKEAARLNLSPSEKNEINSGKPEKTKSEERSRAMTLEALGHKAQLSKLQYAEVKIGDYRKDDKKTVGELIKEIEAKQASRKIDSSVDTYLKVHRGKSFEHSVRDLIAGTDGRRMDELKIVHQKQIEDMKRKVQPNPNKPEEIVADYLADEEILGYLKKRKGNESVDTALSAVSGELQKHMGRIEARELVLASRILKVTS